MKARGAVAVVLAAGALMLWRAELFTVQRPGDRPRPLELLEPQDRVTTRVDATLPAASGGVERLRHDGGVLLLHYWAPWQQHSASQAADLDSLRRLPGFENLRAVVVCFDPFPSVARYVARRRLRLPVLLDTGGALRTQLACPSIPFTYVLDRQGRVAVRQAGEVDWLEPRSIARLHQLLGPAARMPERPLPQPQRQHDSTT